MAGDHTFIDLFSGCGGLALGFRDAGFRSLWAVEMDGDAAATYRANFHHEVFTHDIAEVRLADIPAAAREATVIVGGPPCQGFSPLGRFSPRDEHADMNQLWRQYLRIVEMIGPRIFLIENVPEFLRSREGERAVSLAEEWGYDIDAGILDASEFGVPQKRRRAFVIASRIGEPHLPSSNGARSTVRDALSDIPLEPSERDWHIGRHPKPVSLQRYKLIPPGGNRFDLMRAAPEITPRCWLEKPTGSTDVFGRLRWDEPAVTIRTEFYKPEKGRYLHPEANRPITHREAMRLQTFPDGFEWHGSRISVARQVGNAVPPRLAHALAVSVRALLDSSE